MNNIEDVSISDVLLAELAETAELLAVRNLAITGGEPLLYSGLLEFIQATRKATPLNSFSLTTNGTIIKDKDYWMELIAHGLHKVNVSFSDLLNVDDLEHTATITSYLDNQRALADMLRKNRVKAEANIAILDNDKRMHRLMVYLLNSDISDYFNLTLLPNLSNKIEYEKSKKVISHLKQTLGLYEVDVLERSGTSGRTQVFTSKRGQNVLIKDTKDDQGRVFQPLSICANCPDVCKKECLEGFYGVRLEQQKGKYYARLCLYRDDENALMPLDSFTPSEIAQEIKRLWV